MISLVLALVPLALATEVAATEIPAFRPTVTTFDAVVGANLRSAFLVSRAVLPTMPVGGRIVFLSSSSSHQPQPGKAAYSASKAGLNAMTQSLARALGPHGVLLYVVAPGWVETDMSTAHLSGAEGDAIRAQSPLGRVARPAEVAATVAFLACDDTEYLTGSIVDLFGASYLRS